MFFFWLKKILTFSARFSWNFHEWKNFRIFSLIWKRSKTKPLFTVGASANKIYVWQHLYLITVVWSSNFELLMVSQAAFLASVLASRCVKTLIFQLWIRNRVRMLCGKLFYPKMLATKHPTPVNLAGNQEQKPSKVTDFFSFQLALIRQSVRHQSTVASVQPQDDKPPDYDSAMANPPDYAPVFTITK